MRALGRQAERRSRPHSSRACPFHGRGRRARLAILAGAPPVNSFSSASPLRTRLFPSVWSETAQHNGRHPYDNGTTSDSRPEKRRGAEVAVPTPAMPLASPPLAPLDQAAAVELMRRIKGARSWQQLQSIVDKDLTRMNHVHVSAVVTHMAQLHASSSNSSEGSTSDGLYSRRSSHSAGVEKRSDGLPRADMPQVDDLLSHLEYGTLDFGMQPTTSGPSTPGEAAHVNGTHRNYHHQPSDTRLRWPVGESSGSLIWREESIRLPFQGTPNPTANGGPQPSVREPHATGALHQLLPPPESLALGHRHHHPQYQGGHDARSAFLARLEHAVVTHLDSFEGRQVANTLWAVGKLGHRPSERWLEAVLSRAIVQIHTFNPQHLANTLYALMLLRYMPARPWLEAFCATASRRLHGFGPAELSHFCYAAGKLGLRPGRELLGGVLHHSAMHIDAYGMRELALLLYGVVNMGAVLPADWLRVYRKRVCVLVVRTGALPDRLLEHLAAQGSLVQPELAEMATAQIAQRRQEQQQEDYDGHNLLGREQRPLHPSACAMQPDEARLVSHHHASSLPQQQPLQAASLHPSRGMQAFTFNGSAAGHLATHGSTILGSSSAGTSPDATSPSALMAASYLPTVLLGLAEIGYRPPPVFMSTVLALVGSFTGQLAPAGLTTVLLSLANMRYRPHPALFRRVWNQLMYSLSLLDTQQCTIAVWACATLDCEVPRRDVAAMIMNVAARLPEHSDSEVVQLLEAVSGLGFEPSTSWLELIESDLYNRLPRMQPEEVAPLLLPLAALGHKPHRLWMARWAEGLLAGLPALGLRQLAAATYGAARLGFRPPSRLCSELLAVTAAQMAATVTAAVTLSAVQQEQKPQQGQQAEKQHRVRPAWSRRLGDRSSGRLPETLTRLLWAFAVLDIRPDGGWVSGYLACLRAAVGELSYQERAQVAWAMARLRLEPGPEWVEELAQWRAQWHEQRRRQRLVLGSNDDTADRGKGFRLGAATAQRPRLLATACTAARRSTATPAPLAAPPADPLATVDRVSPSHGSSARDGSSSAFKVAALHHPKDTLDSPIPRATAAVTATAPTAAMERWRICLDVDMAPDTASAVSAESKIGDCGSGDGAVVDVSTLVLKGIHEWAARQLGDPELQAAPGHWGAVALD